MMFDIDQLLAQSGLEASLRRNDGVSWDAFFVNASYRSVAYTASMLDYQQAYFRGAGWEIDDISLVLKSDGKPCGLLPLTIGRLDGKPTLTSVGAPIMTPQFTCGLSPRTIKKFCSRIIVFLQQLGQGLNLDTLHLESAAMPLSGLDGVSPWCQQIMSAGASPCIRHHLYVDLQPDLADIRARFRKSYRPLINKGLRTWKVFVTPYGDPDLAVWDEFRQLHFDVSGRVTRSEESWCHQLEMIKAGQAFLVGLREPEGMGLVGAGFFQFTRDEGVYAAAAYNRSLFDKPMGHVVQQIAIETMKGLGVRWYRIGERHYPQDQPEPSAKEVSISEFKQGFATHMFSHTGYHLPLQGVFPTGEAE
jgi:FemAB family protein